MYRLTIIPTDGSVYFDDKVVLGLDLSFIPEWVGALQWRIDAGWIENVDQRIVNVDITELPEWATQAYEMAEAAYIPPVDELSQPQGE